MGFGSQILGFGAFPSRGPGAYVPTHAAVFDGSAEYLQSTPTKEGSRYKYTIATWFKHGTLGLSNTGLFSGDTSNAGFLRFSSDAIDFGENGGSQQIHHQH